MQQNMPLSFQKSFAFPTALDGAKSTSAEAARPASPNLFRGILIGLAIEGAVAGAILLAIRLFHSY